MRNQPTFKPMPRLAKGVTLPAAEYFALIEAATLVLASHGLAASCTEETHWTGDETQQARLPRAKRPKKGD